MDFTVTDSTTLEDLLALQLHLLEDEVRNIVDKAVKEMAIEKVLLQLIIYCDQTHQHQESFSHNDQLYNVTYCTTQHFW